MSATQRKDLTPVEQQEVMKQLQSLKMYKRALEFIVLLGHCVPAVESLLKSKTLSDVVETLRFIRRYEFFDFFCMLDFLFDRDIVCILFDCTYH